MKKLRFLFATIFLVSLAVSCEYTATEGVITRDSNNTSESFSLVSYPTNASLQQERTNWGCGDFMFKIDNWNSSITGAIQVTDEEGNPLTGVTITISNNNGKTFDWSIAGATVCTALVKGGQDAIVYVYNNQINDYKLVAPLNLNTPDLNDTYDISHVTFFFSLTNQCYDEETAWTAGNRYNVRGNWATYTSYAGVEKTVEIYAGQTLLAGTATLSAPNASNMVTITINLNSEFIFYYGTPVSENLKIQPYTAPPTGNPNPGGFLYKQVVNIGSYTATETVMNAPFYGIHLDVAKLVPCE
jgi:hypothetical protein